MYRLVVIANIFNDIEEEDDKYLQSNFHKFFTVNPTREMFSGSFQVLQGIKLNFTGSLFS